jgi:phospholipid/cholesterol/gamma-HCH transport system permease protein
MALALTPDSPLLRPLRALGRYVLLLVQAFRTPGSIRVLRRNLAEQCVSLGLASLPIIAMAAAFSGAVTTVQAAYQLESPLVPVSVIGAIVAPSIILELAAIISGFLLAGRVGARIAAELGTMRVSEQIDALEAMGLSAAGYLVAPRVLAGVVMVPVLYVAACVVGIGAGVWIGDATGALTAEEFILGARQFFRPFDAVFGLIKAVTFGFIITSVACYKGFYARGGSGGVGRATTQAAVTACVYILFADLLLAILLL